MKILLNAILFAAAVLPAAEKFSFIRPLSAGSCFQCFIQTRQSAQYTFRIPGRDDPVVKLDTVQADFAGFLQIRQVNASGHPSAVRIRVDRLTGSLNGKIVKNRLSPGVWLEAVLSPDRTSFSVDGKPVPQDFHALLNALFPAAESSTSLPVFRFSGSPDSGTWKQERSA